jgi:hypothetical protein
MFRKVFLLFLKKGSKKSQAEDLFLPLLVSKRGVKLTADVWSWKKSDSFILKTKTRLRLKHRLFSFSCVERAYSLILIFFPLPPNAGGKSKCQECG